MDSDDQQRQSKMSDSPPKTEEAITEELRFVLETKPDEPAVVLSLDDAFKRYDEALELKSTLQKQSKKLVELDQWYRTTLRDKLHKDGVINKLDLVKLVEWKLARGRFRPTLAGLAQSNPDRNVERVSRRAFEVIKESPTKAMDILCELRGIGPATASAIVAVFNPNEPFFSDEATLAVGLGTPKYTAQFYEQFKALMVTKLASTTDAFDTMEDLEKACWAKSILETNGQTKAAFDERERARLDATGKRKWDHAHKKAGRGKKAKYIFEAKQATEAKKAAGGSGANKVQASSSKKEASAGENKAPAAKK